MRFKLDENLPVELCRDLRDLGFEADTVRDEGLTGAPDAEVVVVANSERRVLLTLDKGLADTTRYAHGKLAGVVLFRPPHMGRGGVMDFVRRRLGPLLRLELSSRLTVVTDGGFRQR